ncbi:MAG: P-loop NTPase [Cyanobacteria bacterium SZAS LIN-3]|nr:P-loop NTPase [Cyanobacteria bacterium SZAS LIN-3]
MMTYRLFKPRTAKQTQAKVSRPVDQSLPPQAAPIVAVLGAKGGVGASTIAVNLAAAAALSGRSTTLVDGNFQSPDIANILGREADHSLLELTARGSEVDRLLYQACRLEVADCSDNLGALLPPSEGDAGVESNLTELTRCLEQVRYFDELFVVDMPRHLDRHLVTLLDKCAVIVLVFEATISGVAACRRWMQIFTELGYGKERIMLVVNRAGSKYKVVEDELGTCFAGMTTWKIPNASSLAQSSANQGIPVVVKHANSPYSKAINELAADLQTILSGGK